MISSELKVLQHFRSTSTVEWLRLPCHWNNQSLFSIVVRAQNPPLTWTSRTHSAQRRHSYYIGQVALSLTSLVRLLFSGRPRKTRIVSTSQQATRILQSRNFIDRRSDELADESLFNNVLRFEHHILNSLLPPTKEHQHSLRPRQHDWQLLAKTNTLTLSRPVTPNGVIVFNSGIWLKVFKHLQIKSTLMKSY